MNAILKTRNYTSTQLPPPNCIEFYSKKLFLQANTKFDCVYLRVVIMNEKMTDFIITISKLLTKHIKMLGVFHGRGLYNYLCGVLQSDLLSFSLATITWLPSHYIKRIPIQNYKIRIHYEPIERSDKYKIDLEMLNLLRNLHERNCWGFECMVQVCCRIMTIWKFCKQSTIGWLPRDVVMIICRMIWISRYDEIWYSKYTKQQYLSWNQQQTLNPN